MLSIVTVKKYQPLFVVKIIKIVNVITFTTPIIVLVKKVISLDLQRYIVGLLHP